jgi:hypothetical protein
MTCLFQYNSYNACLYDSHTSDIYIQATFPFPIPYAAFFTRLVTFSSISLSDNPSNDSLFSFPNSKLRLVRSYVEHGVGREADHI